MRIKLGIAVLSAMLSLAAAEAVLRRSDPQWMVFDPPVCFRPDLFEQSSFGYRLHPGLAKPYTYPKDAPRSITLRANAQGFRGRRDLNESDPRLRIVVAGDSMVFGQGVEEEERFTEQLEARRADWRVDNLGMVGYGTDLMLRALEAVGLEPAPDVVVLAVFTDDLRRVAAPYAGVGFPIPRFALEGGDLRTVPYPTPRLWERSLVFQWARYAYWRYTEATFPLNAAILDRFLALARERGFAPVVLFLPGPREHRDDRMRRDFLAAWAARRGVVFLDLTAALRAGGGDELYIPGDSHWSPAGHRVVAQELERLIARHALPAKPGARATAAAGATAGATVAAGAEDGVAAATGEPVPDAARASH